MYWFFMIAIFFGVSSAIADENKDEAVKTEIVVSKEDCAKLVSGAEYIPNVDVYGRSVVSADINGGYEPIKIPDEFSTDIRVELAGKYGLKDSFKAEDFNLGKVTFKNNQVYFNDSPLSKEDVSLIEEACRKKLP